MTYCYTYKYLNIEFWAHDLQHIKNYYNMKY